MYNTASPVNSSAWMSKEAISLANRLMINLQIQQGANLSKLLGVNSIFYNDEAIKVWVQKELDEGLTLNNYTLQILQDRFIEIMHSHNISFDEDLMSQITGGLS